MKKLQISLIAVLLFALSVTNGQNPYSAVYPTGVVTDTQIYVGSSNARSSLAAAISSVQTTIVVRTASTFLVGNLVTIDSEKLLLTANNGSVTGGIQFTVVRGADFSTPASHGNGAGVSNVISPGYPNRVSKEVEAIEFDLITPYQSTVTAQTGVTLNASTHNKGLYAWALCFDNASPRNIRPCTWTRDASGNLVFAFNPAFTGLIEVRR